MKQIAFFTNIGLLFILWIAYNQFENFLSTVQYEEKVPWLPASAPSTTSGSTAPAS